MKNIHSIEKRVIDLINAIIETHEYEISLESTIEDTPAWDSLTHLQIVSGIEGWIGRQLNFDEIIGITCVQDCIKIVSANV